MFDQFSMGKLHHLGGVVQDVAVGYDVVWRWFLKVVRDRREIPAFIDLVVDVGGRVGRMGPMT